MNGKPLQVNCAQLAPFPKFYKATAVSKTKVSIHCIQNNLFKSQAKPETSHAKNFLAQAERQEK